MYRSSLLTLIYLFILHFIGIYLFTRGFLLSRLSLPNVAPPTVLTDYPEPTHIRLVLLIIDALRFDFISPAPHPEPISSFHHGVLTVPAELTAKHPDRSWIFNAHSDPPTTTLQRIKGLTTGGLPTFVDVGSNFGGASVVEDSIVTQMISASKKITFAGDDTWLTIFSALSGLDANPNVTAFPYDSFNVEDLHTVDEGVISHLIPALASENASKWDIFIGHMLGVDHVGHRLSPSHPSMTSKLTQMDVLLRSVVSKLQEGDLLVVMGDHGMSSGGDHGGDSPLETSSALWIYSTTSLPSSLWSSSPPPSTLPTTLFPGHSKAYRAINQIDLLPTLSVLFGLPIPFNNLGSIIPELFPTSLAKVTNINAAQITSFLHAYRSSKSGGELDNSWWTLMSSYDKASNVEEKWVWMRLVLEECRSLWAQFDFVLMGMGLAVLAFSLWCAISIYAELGKQKNVDLVLSMKFAGGGLIVGADAGWLSTIYGGPSAISWVLMGTALGSTFPILRVPSYELASPLSILGVVPMALHALSLASNSYTIWEDHIIPFLFLTTLAPSALVGISSPTAALRSTILWRLLAIGVLTRAMGLMGRVCREEQVPCSSSFYLHPILSILASLVMAGALPWYIEKHILGKSKSDGGSAPVFMSMVLRPAMIVGSLMWTIEYLETSDIQLPLISSLPISLRTIRTILAWFAFPLSSTLGVLLWSSFPLCLTITREEEQKRVTILGYANASGAPFFLFFLIPFIGVWTASPPMGQIVLGCGVIILGCLVEMWDAVRDVEKLRGTIQFAQSESAADRETEEEEDPISFGRHITPLVLLSLHAFFSTGHQASIPTIQWKTAFLLTSTQSFGYGPLTVVLNSFGPVLFFAVAAPLIALWNISPMSLSAHLSLETKVMRTIVGTGIYSTTLLLASSVTAAVLRRHLMVWKIFAPRYMLSAVLVLVIDIGGLIAVIGAERIGKKVKGAFFVQRVEHGKKAE